MQDDLERLRGVWQKDERKVEDLVAAVRREHRKQLVVLFVERLLCAVAIGVGIVLLRSPDATLRVLGTCVAAFAVAGGIIAQWGRAMLVKRLADPVPAVAGSGADAKQLASRLSTATRLMIALGTVFAIVVVAVSSQRTLHSGPQLLPFAIVLGGAAFLIGTAMWEHRHGRRRRQRLHRLFSFQTKKAAKDE